MLFSICGFTQQKWERLRTVESPRFFNQPQVSWQKVTFIRPLLMQNNDTLYKKQATPRRSPHGFSICSQFTFPRHSIVSHLPPLLQSLLPSSCRLDSALESCERTRTSYFFLVLSPSAISVLFLHMLPRCHPSADFASAPSLRSLWSLRSGFPRWRDKWLGSLPRSRLKCGGQVTLISVALQWGHRVD